ncbi:hypothetical protein TEA_021979 [Camellia sinensis var. sinensis]|uniref:Kinesin-like protein n=1 Tax=Camellia sinensis var. sinensis TaxID=542762 RepID=A0A4S4ELF0_CAMSN|nr:hypothetical protein TEA_021979 [Camellia sinensis var. sinensis]
MASGGGGGGYRNGIHKAAVKVDRPFSAPSNLRPSSSFKSKLPPAPATANGRRSSPGSHGGADSVSGRVRVAVRLRPRNDEELVADADFADCVELQPELKRLKLRKNNWDSDTYEFDEVLTEFASQKRVYEVVAKPVVELKRLKLRKNNWDSDTYEFDEVLTEFASQKRVYEVVAKPVVERITTYIHYKPHTTETKALICVVSSSLHLSTSIQLGLGLGYDFDFDFNFQSVLDGYNGTVMAYGQTGTGKTYTLGRLGDEDTSARGIMVRAMEDILADISLGTDSISVSYLQLYMETIQDLLNPANDNIAIVEDSKTGDISLPGATLVKIRDQQSFLELLQLGEVHRFAANTKLNTESSRSHAILMVHVKKSVLGREATFPNENHNPSHSVNNFKPPVIRKAKLILVDLAGSERIHKSGSEGHMLEEAKSINLSLSALGKCINALAENSAHVPVRDSKLTRLLRDSFGGSARTSLIVTIGPSPRHRAETASTILFGQRAMKVENMLKIKEEFDYKSLSRRLEIQLDKLVVDNERQQKAFEDEIERITLEAQSRISEAESNFADALEGHVGSVNEEVSEVKKLLQGEITLRKAAEEEIGILRNQLDELMPSEAGGNADVMKLQGLLEDETHQRKRLEEEVMILQSQLSQLSFETDQTRNLDRGRLGNVFTCGGSVSNVGHSPLKDVANGRGALITSLHEQVGLQKIFSLLESEDPNVRLHAVKVVANLAAEETNQERIVEAGGLTSLLMLLRRLEDETVRRVAAGAIANLAMNEANQELIMAQGGIGLLATTAADAEDPQTLRMVAGAIANLCGNDKLQTRLRSEGGVKALLEMVRCRHPDVLAQVARGIANFAKCESRGSTHGTKTGKSRLIEDGALPWIVRNSNNEASLIRRHTELALCHLAQHGEKGSLFLLLT